MSSSPVTRLQGELHIDHAAGIVTFHAAQLRIHGKDWLVHGPALMLRNLPTAVPTVVEEGSSVVTPLVVVVHQASVSWQEGRADVNMAAMLTIADTEGNIKDVPLDYETSWEDQGFVVFKAYGADGTVYMFRLAADDAREALGKT